MALMLDDLKNEPDRGIQCQRPVPTEVTGRCGCGLRWMLISVILKASGLSSFGIHRDHSRGVSVKVYGNAGFRAEHVDGDDPPARRDRIMNWNFKTGGIDIVGNCDLIIGRV